MNRRKIFRKVISVFLSFTILFCNSVFADTAQIIVDGRTDTNLDINGNTTNVTTNTVKGSNAFNSFDRFNVHAGNVVNLHVPGAANNLINLVHKDSTRIDGVLNSIKNGSLGGNVYLLNPNGIIVGANGVVNVGSLTMGTPSKEFMDVFFDANGNISDQATQAALNSSYANSGALVDIQGRVNSLGDIRINAGEYVQSGIISTGPSASKDLFNFGSMVNISGVEQTNGFALDQNGDVYITASNDITLEHGAKILANGGENSDAGDVVLFADNDSNFENGAVIDARGGSVSGDGGFIEFSAKKNVRLKGGKFLAYADNGKNGRIFIDPENLTITTSTYSHGADIDFQADDTLIVEDGVVISSRKISGDPENLNAHKTAASTADSGKISFDAQHIKIRGDSSILSFADSGFISGDIDIIADAYALVPSLIVQVKSRTSSVEISDCFIKGGDVTVRSKADTSKYYGDYDELLDKALDFFNSLSILAGVAISEADSSVKIGSGAVIEANSVDILSHSKAEAKVKAVSTALGVAYGETDSNALVEIANDASITATNDVVIKAKAESDLDIQAYVVTLGAGRGSPVDFTFAMGDSEIDSTVDIKSGASVSSNEGNLDIDSDVVKKQVVGALAGAYENGMVGMSGALSLSNTNAKVNVDGELKARQNITINSKVDDQKNDVSAISGAGSGLVSKIVVGAANSLIDRFKNQSAGTKTDSNRKIGLSAAVAWSEETNLSEVTVGGSADIISTNGGIDIESDLISKPHIAAISMVDTSEGDITLIPTDEYIKNQYHTKENAIAGAVSYGKLNNTSNSLIGDGADLDAYSDLRVVSTLRMPYEQTWWTFNDGDTFGDVMKKLPGFLFDKLNSNLGLENGIFTTYTQAFAMGTKTSFSGSVNLLDINNSSNAIVGENVKINQRNAIVADNGKVRIEAQALVDTIDISGVFAAGQLKSIVGGLTGKDNWISPTNTYGGIGGSYIDINYNNNVNAIVKGGTAINAKQLDILANTVNKVIAIGEAGGAAGGAYVINGVVSFVGIDNNSLSCMYDNVRANIISSNPGSPDNLINVKAEDSSTIYNISGGVTKSQNIGAGASVSFSEINRNTEAAIGYRDGDYVASDNDLIETNKDISVGAKNVGDIYSFSLAAAVATGLDNRVNPNNWQQVKGSGNYGIAVSGDVSFNDIDDSAISYVAGVKELESTGLDVESRNETDILAISGSAAISSSGKNSAGLAGSYTENKISSDSKAYVKDTEATIYGDVDIESYNINRVQSINASGSASRGISVAGSVALNKINNTIESYVKDSALNRSGSLDIYSDDSSTVEAIAGTIVFGSKAAVGASVGLNEINNNVRTYVEDSVLDSDSTARLMTIENAKIQALAAGVAVGKTGTLAGSVTWNEIKNNVESYVSGNTQIDTDTGFVLKAEDTATINSLAGQLAIGVGLAPIDPSDPSGGSTAGSAFAVGAAAAYNNITDNVRAYTAKKLASDTLQIDSRGGIDIDAKTVSSVKTLSAGGTGGAKFNMAGSVGITEISNNTQAIVEDSIINTTDSIYVDADDQTDVQSIAGTIAAGVVGVAGSVGLNKITNNVGAHIKNSNTNANEMTHVKAKSDEEIDVYNGSAALAQYGALSGAVSVNSIATTTQSSLSGSINKATLAGARDQQKINVEVEDIADINAVNANLAVSIGASGGAAVDVSSIKNTSSASIADGTQVESTAGIDIIANSQKQGTSVTAAGAGGKYLGASGSVAVYNIGSSNSDEGLEAVADIQSYVESQNANGTDLSSDFDVSSSDVYETTAYVGDNVNVVSGANVNIDADEKVELTINAGNLAGGFVAIGGAVGVANIETNVDSHLGKNSTIDTAGNIDISANGIIDRQDKSSDLRHMVNTYNGSVGAVGLGAAVSYVNTKNNVSSYVDNNSKIYNAGIVTVSADSNSDIGAYGYGAAVGLGAVGGVVGHAIEDGETKAYLGDNVEIADKTDATKTVGSLNLNASSKTKVDTYTMSSSGGVVAAAGADSYSVVDNKVTATTGSNNNISTTALSLNSNAVTKAEAEARGYFGGGLSAGISSATSTVSPYVRTAIGSSNDIDVDSLYVRSSHNAVDDKVADSLAIAAGGALIGGTATFAKSHYNGQVFSHLGSYSNVDFTDELVIQTNNNSKQNAVSKGSYGALIAAGGNISDAISDTETISSVGNNVNITDSGNRARRSINSADSSAMRVHAYGSDTNNAESVSGSGGILSGAGAHAKTDSKSDTKAIVYSNSSNTRKINVDSFSIKSDHSTNFNSFADTRMGSVIGASAALATNNVDSKVKSELQDGVKIDTYDIRGYSFNSITKGTEDTGYNTEAASGGAIDGAASYSKSYVDNYAKFIVGDNVKINLLGNKHVPGAFIFRAYNNVNLFDKAKLDNGGAITIALAKSIIENDRNDAIVNIGDNARFISVGDIDISAETDAKLVAKANAKTYGLSGWAEGESKATVGRTHNDNSDADLDNNKISDNLVKIGTNAFFRTDGNMTFSAGGSSDTQNVIDTLAETRLWNKTAIPIGNDPEAYASVKQDNKVIIGTSSNPWITSEFNGNLEDSNHKGFYAVKDIFVNAKRGSANAKGDGEGTDLYRQLAEDVAGLVGIDLSLEITGGDDDLDVDAVATIDGLLRAGIQNKQYLHFDSLGNAIKQSEGVSFHKTTNESLLSNLQSQIDDLVARKASLGSTSPEISAAYDAEIQFLENKKTQYGSSNPTANYINVHDIWAQSSNIWLNGETVNGSGTLLAPGDALIDIKNPSKYFLRFRNQNPASQGVAEFTIPDTEGGKLFLNGVEVLVEDRSTKLSSFSRIETSEDSTKPVISIENSYNPDLPGNDGIGTDIEITGNISNFNGDVIIKSNKGSVVVKTDTAAGMTQAPVIRAETIDIAAGKDFIQSYVDGIYNVSGEADSYWQDIDNNDDNDQRVFDEAQYFDWNKFSSYAGTNFYRRDYKDYPSEQTAGQKAQVVSKVNTAKTSDLTRSTAKATIAGNNVFIAAKNINVNGTIQSGIPDWTLTLSDSLNTTIANFQSNYVASDPTTHILSLDPGDYYWSGVYKSSNIEAQYNAATGKIEIEGVRVEGGNMMLAGKISSTGNGRLNVLDGYGKINITNNTNYDIQLGDLHTGNGVEGTLTLIDNNFSNPSDSSSFKQTTYKFDRLNNKIKKYNSYTKDATHTAAHQLDNSIPTGRVTTYQPKAGQYYSVYNKQRETITMKRRNYKLTCFVAAECDSDSSASASSSSSVAAPVRDDIITMFPGHTEDYWYDSRDVYVSDTGWYMDTSYYGGDGYDSEGWSVAGVDIWKKEWWRRERKRYYDHFHTHNIKAFYPIDINFIGYNTGAVDVTSTKNIYMNGNITNILGTTNISSSAGAIIQNGDGNNLINSNVISLRARDGVYGQHSNSSDMLRLDSRGGLVNISGYSANPLNIVNSNGKINVEEIRGDLSTSAIYSNSAVKISADGDLVGLNGLVDIKGSTIDIESKIGKVRGINGGLKIDSTTRVDVVAPGTVDLKETSGDLRVGTIESKGADVNISTVNGAVLDVSEENDTLSDDQVQELLNGLWSDMRLVARAGETGEDLAQDTIDSYKNLQARKAQRYDMYKEELGADYVYDENTRISLSTEEITYLKTEQDWLDADITKLEDQKTLEFHALHEEYVTDLESGNTPFQVVQATIDEMIEGVEWNENQLRYSVGRGFLKEVSDTEAMVEQANVKGVNVNINANGQIGETKPGTVTINLEAFESLSPADKKEKLAVLAAAERDDLQKIDLDGDGDIDRFVITQRQDLDVEASGNLDAFAVGAAYLGSEDDININSVSATGNVRIKGAKGIYNASDNGTANIESLNAVIEAGDDNIGTAVAPLLVDLLNNGELTLRAGEDIYLKELTGDILLDTLYAVDDANLVAEHNILAAYDDGLNIRAGYVNLNAGRDIGSSSNYLDVAVDPDGQFNSDAGTLDDGINPQTGSIYVDTPYDRINIGHTRAIDYVYVNTDGVAYVGTADEGIESGRAVYINSEDTIFDGDNDGEWNIKSPHIEMHANNGSVGNADNPMYVDVTSSNTINASAPDGVYIVELNGDMFIGDVSSANGDVELAAVTGGVYFDQIRALNGDVLIDAYGNIDGNPADGIDIIAQNITVDSETGVIGVADDKFVIDALSGNADSVNLYGYAGIDVVENDGDLNAGDIISNDGMVSIAVNNGKINVQNLYAEKGVNIKTKEDINLSSDKMMNVASLESTDGDITLISKIGIKNALNNGAANVKANNVTLDSGTGGVGTDTAHFLADSYSKFNIESEGSIFAEEINGNLVSDYIISTHGGVDFTVQNGNSMIAYLYGGNDSKLKLPFDKKAFTNGVDIDISNKYPSIRDYQVLRGLDGRYNSKDVSMLYSDIAMAKLSNLLSQYDMQYKKIGQNHRLVDKEYGKVMNLSIAHASSLNDMLEETKQDSEIPKIGAKKIDIGNILSDIFNLNKQPTPNVVGPQEIPAVVPNMINIMNVPAPNVMFYHSLESADEISKKVYDLVDEQAQNDE